MDNERASLLWDSPTHRRPAQKGPKTSYRSSPACRLAPGRHRGRRPLDRPEGRCQEQCLRCHPFGPQQRRAPQPLRPERHKGRLARPRRESRNPSPPTNNASHSSEEPRDEPLGGSEPLWEWFDDALSLCRQAPKSSPTEQGVAPAPGATIGTPQSSASCPRRDGETKPVDDREGRSEDAVPRQRAASKLRRALQQGAARTGRLRVSPSTSTGPHHKTRRSRSEAGVLGPNSRMYDRLQEELALTPKSRRQQCSRALAHPCGSVMKF